MTKQIIFLYGIPGSGKTHYARSQEETGNVWLKTRGAYVIDIDKLTRSHKVKERALNDISNQVYHLLDRDAKKIILDGLITTNCQVQEIANAICCRRGYAKQNIEFELVWWELDREACRWNDLYRRSQDSLITIDNCLLQEPDPKMLEGFMKKENITKKKVERKPEWKVWAGRNDLGQEEK